MGFADDLDEADFAVAEDPDVGRSPAFPFYATDWLGSTITGVYMDAEQRGWFIQLLCRAWCSPKEFPHGTLPNDDAKLRKMADFEGVNSYRIKPHKHCALSPEITEEIAAEEAAKWDLVRAQFVEYPANPLLIHNEKLTKIIHRSSLYRKRRSRAGKEGAKARWKPNAAIDNKGLNDNRINVSKRSVSDTHDEPMTTSWLSCSSSTSTQKESNNSPKSSRQPKESIREIFEYWKLIMQKRGNTVLDGPRELRIRRSLEFFSVVDLKKAIFGCSKSPFHMGKNDDGKKFNDITLILRNASKIETFMGYADNPPTERNANGKSQFDRLLAEIHEEHGSDTAHEDSPPLLSPD